MAGNTVLVTDGTYQVGSSSFSRVAVPSHVVLQSIKGPAGTVIKGYQVPGITNGAGSLNCANLGNGSMISGFTLTNGSSPVLAGGIDCPAASGVVSNCIITGNCAAGPGGG